MSRRLQAGLNRMQWIHSLDMVTQPCTKTLDASWTTAVWEARMHTVPVPNTLAFQSHISADLSFPVPPRASHDGG